MTWFAVIIIFVALGMIIGNVILLKHSAKMSFKNINQDPIENAKKELERRKQSDK